MNHIQLYAFADEADNCLDGQIAAMRSNGLQGIEIRNVDGINVSELSVEKARETAAKLHENDLEVWSVGSPIGKIDIVHDCFSDHLEKLKHTLDIAHVLGTDRIRVFSFYFPDHDDPEEYRNEVIDRMGTMLDIAEVEKIQLYHENEKKIYGDTAARCLELFQHLPQLRGIFDPANYVQCGENTWNAWKQLKSHTNYLHVKDALSDGTVVPAGYGEGNVTRIISEYIMQGGYAMTVEPHLTVFDGLADLEQKGNESIIGGHFIYQNNREAFDSAVGAVKNILDGLITEKRIADHHQGGRL